MHLVFVAFGRAQGAAPSAVTERDAVVLKSAESELSSTSASVNVGVAKSAGVEGLGNPVLEAVGFWRGLRCHSVM